MNKKIVITLLTLGLISLFLPIGTTIIGLGITEPVSNDFTIKGTDFYFEDFTTANNRNDPETSAYWGQGYVSASRNWTYTPLDFIPTDAPVYELEFQGRIGYALKHNDTNPSEQLMTFSCVDPTNLVVLKTLSSNWRAGTALDVDGVYLYAGLKHTSGPLFGVYNTSDPTLIVPHWGYVKGDGVITDIDSEGRYVYYVGYNNTGSSSLYRYDAEDPTVASLPIYIPFPSKLALGLTVEGRYAYIAAGTDGLYITNISKGFNPLMVGHVNIPGNASDVLVDGNLAYVVTLDGGLYIVDVSNPLNPQIIGMFESSGQYRRLVKQGNTLIVACGDEGVRVFNVANPTNPVRVISLSVGYAYDVALYGGAIGVASSDGIYLLQLSSSSSGITSLNRANFINVYDTFEAWDVQIHGNTAFIAGGPDGFYALDVTYPENPVLLDRWNQTGLSFKRLDIDGQYAYLIDTQNIVIFDISDPTNIRHLNTITLFSTGVTDCFVLGHELYMSWGGGSIVNFDITFPATTVIANATHELFLGNNITSIWGQGRHIYAVNNALGASVPAIYTISAQDVTNLAVTDSYAGATYMNDIFVDGEIAYTANRLWTILFDIDDPSNIGYSDSVTTTYCEGVAGFGQYFFTADKFDGLIRYDASNVFAFLPIDDIPSLTRGMQVKTYGDYIYYVNKTGLSIIRHFESAADTYDAGIHTAESVTVGSIEGLIHEAVLDGNAYIPEGTNIIFQLSANGGADWETVTFGVGVTFANPGNDLRWRAIIDGTTYRSAYIYDLSIEYNYNLQPTQPEIEDLGDSKFTGILTVKWNATDDVAIDHFELEVSDSSSFTTVLKSWTLAESSKTMYGLGKGTHYFRVRAFDDEGLVSDWSLTASVDITLSTLMLGIILGSGLLVIIITIIVVSVVVRKKRKKVTTR